MSELEEPHDLLALFADERDAYPEDLAARARVMRRIEASIAFGVVGATTAAVAAKTGLLASLGVHAAKHAKLWIALSLATGIVVGETHARLAAPTPTPEPATSIPAHTPTASIPATATAPASASSELAAIPIASLPPALTPSAPPTPASAAPSNLAAEQTLIDTARSALTRGRADDALRATEAHAREFPRGRLAEERETMAIQALLLAGRRGDAEARGQRFHAAYPGSLYGNAVDALLAPRTDGGR